MKASLFYLIALFILCQTNPLFAQKKVEGFTGSAQEVQATDLIPHLKKDDGYSEKYTFNAEFTGTDRFYFSYQITNLGAGAFKMTAKGSLKLGDRTFQWKTDELELDDQEWKYDKNKLSIEVEGFKLSGTIDQLKFEVQKDDFQIVLDFTPIAKAWKPKNGKLFADQKVSSYLVFPLTYAKGFFSKGEEKIELNGKGYGTHTWSQLGPHELFAWTTQFRGVQEESNQSFYFRQLRTHGDYEKKTAFYLLATDQDQIVAECFDAQIIATQVYTDQKHDNQYQVNESFELKCKDSRTGAEIIASIKANKQSTRKNPLSKLNWVVRKLAESVSEPMEYVYDKASYELSVGGKKYSGKNGMYEINYFNAEK
jgi:hypothetical protein